MTNELKKPQQSSVAQTTWKIPTPHSTWQQHQAEYKSINFSFLASTAQKGITEM